MKKTYKVTGTDLIFSSKSKKEIVAVLVQTAPDGEKMVIGKHGTHAAASKNHEKTRPFLTGEFSNHTLKVHAVTIVD